MDSPDKRLEKLIQNLQALAFTIRNFYKLDYILSSQVIDANTFSVSFKEGTFIIKVLEDNTFVPLFIPTRTIIKKVNQLYTMDIQQAAVALEIVTMCIDQFGEFDSKQAVVNMAQYGFEKIRTMSNGGMGTTKVVAFRNARGDEFCIRIASVTNNLHIQETLAATDLAQRENLTYAQPYIANEYGQLMPYLTGEKNVVDSKPAYAKRGFIPAEKYEIIGGFYIDIVSIEPGFSTFEKDEITIGDSLKSVFN